MANEEDQESIEGLELETESSNEQEDTNNESESSQDDENIINLDSDEESIASDAQDGNQSPIQGKFTKNKKMILIAAAATGVILIIIIMLFLFGLFDSEPVKTQSVKINNTDQVEVTPPKKTYRFNLKDINKKRLNRKLALLTKDEIIPLEIEEVITPANPIEEKPWEAIVTISEINTDENNKEETSSEKQSQMQVNNEHENVENVTPSQNESPKMDDVPLIEENDEIKDIKDKKDIQDLEEDTTTTIKQNTQIQLPVEFEAIEKDNELIQNIIDNEMMDEPIVKENMMNDTKDLPIQENKIMDNNSTSDLATEDMSEEINSKLINEKETMIELDSMQQHRSFLMFVQVATIKTKLYLSFLQKINKIDKRISVCRSNINQIEIFVGPFDNESSREEVLSKINLAIVNDAFAIDFTKEEFDKRCKL